MNRILWFFLGVVTALPTPFISAADVHWKDADTSGLWTDGGKWSNGIPPHDGDTPYLDRSGIVVTITDAVDNTFLEFKGPGHGTGITDAVLNIEGGSIKVLPYTTNETFRIAYSSGSSGRVNMSGGRIEIGDVQHDAGDLQAGRRGAGELLMTGGEIRIARDLQVPATSDGNGHVKLYGDSTMWIGRHLFRGAAGQTRIDIGGGALILAGDKRPHIQDWIDHGHIVAYDGHLMARLAVDYDPEVDETRVTSTLYDVNRPAEPLPWDGQSVNHRTNLSLIWVPDENVSRQHIYLGTDFDAVRQACTEDTSGIFRGAVGSEVYFYSVSSDALEKGKTYYWRVDTVYDGHVFKGDIWRFEAIAFVIPLHGDLNDDGKVDLNDLALAAFAYMPDDLSSKTVVADIARNWLLDRNVMRPIYAPFDTGGIVVPTFPDADFMITDYGAESGGYFDNRQAFHDAIDHCSASGGGRVVVPAGVWFTGPIRLKSNVNLHLEDGAEIRFSTDINDYPPIYIYPNARPDMGQYRPTPFIYADNAVNIGITGNGSAVINVQARTWSDDAYWKAFRVNCIWLANCENILIDSVTLLYGPTWNIVVQYSKNAIIRNLDHITKGPAADGIDIVSSKDVLIEHCYIAVGDDAIVMKTDRDEVGWAVNIPTERVVARNCYLQTPMAALVIGSEMSGGVRDILFQDCFIGDDTGTGFWVKSRRGRGGVVENVWVKDITMESIRAAGKAINLNMNYYMPPTPATEVPPTFRNIFVENIRCKQATTGLGGLIQLRGLPESWIDNITMSNVIGIEPGGFGIYAEYAKNLHFDKIAVNPFPLWHPGVEFYEIQDAIVENASSPSNLELFFKIHGVQTRRICLIDNTGAMDYLVVDDSVPDGETSVEDCP